MSAYFPLEASTTWYYLQDNYREVEVVIADNSVDINGTATRVMEFSGGDPNGMSRYFTNDGEGLRLHRIITAGSGVTMTMDPPIEIASADTGLGQTSYTEGEVLYQAPGQEDEVRNYTATSRLMAQENVGGWYPALKFLFTNTITDDRGNEEVEVHLIWLVEEVGMVKSQIANQDNITIELVLTDASFFPAADFSAAPLTGPAPLTVDFTESSTGTITGRSWDFGDGDSGDTRDPSHVYSRPGSFTPALTVTGVAGITDTLAWDRHIRVFHAGADANADGRLDLADAIILLRLLSDRETAGLTPTAGIAGDNTAGMREIGYTLQFVSGLR